MITLLSAISGCTNSSALYASSTCYYPDASNTRAPGWICHQQTSDQILTAVGFAESSSAGASFTKKMALAQARVKLAQSLKAHCGLNHVTDVMLVNSTLLNSQLSPKDGLYVQIQMKPSDFQLNCQ